MLSRTVKQYIADNDLLSAKAKYLVALSGGADSVCLLRLLLELGYNIEAAHCNFRLRGEESDRDETFCKTLCKQLDVTLHIAHFDTRTYAALHKVSIEMAARDLRYNYFSQLVQDLSFDGVCVAHHKDDSVETVLLNMVRGTGIEGLKGIAPRNGIVLRPLLCTDRQELEQYLAAIHQDYITDSTNMEDDVQRNKLRLNVIPLLKTVNPAASENIAKTAKRVDDALRILGKAISDAKQRVAEEKNNTQVISIKLLLSELSPELILWELLKDKGFISAQVEQIFTNLNLRIQSGREWLSKTHALLIDRDCIIVEPLTTEVCKQLVVPETGVYVYDEKQKLSFNIVDIDNEFVLTKTSDCVCLDAAKVRFPLVVRRVKQGDTFVPFGMKGRKLLSDFLTDRKMSLFQKRRQLVVADADDNIVWVVGLRPDNNFCITKESHQSLVIILTHSELLSK